MVIPKIARTAAPLIAPTPRAPGSGAPAETPARFDLEAAYDEVFRRVPEPWANERRTGEVLRTAPALSTQEWVWGGPVAGGWDDQVGELSGAPALAGLQGKDLAELVLALMRDRAGQGRARGQSGGDGDRAEPATPAESAPAAASSTAPAPLVRADFADEGCVLRADSAPTESAVRADTGPATIDVPADSALSAKSTVPADSALAAEAAPQSGWGQLDRLAPAEYAAFRADPSRDNFDRLVAAVALPQYASLKSELESAYARLSDAEGLAQFAATTGLEAYQVEQLAKSAGVVDYTFAEFPDGNSSFVNELYMNKFREKYPGLGSAEYAKYDLSKMTKEQFLSLPAEHREKMISVLESIDPESAQHRLAQAMKTLAAAGVDGSNFEAAKNAAVERHAELVREHPELIALLRENSPFSYDLCKNMPPADFRFDGSGFHFSPNISANLDHVYARSAAMGAEAFLPQLGSSIGEIDKAISQIQKNPEFEKLSFIAIEVARRIGADAEFFQGAPEGADYQAASGAADKYLGDAARERKLRDIGMTALGGVTAALGVGALVGGFFSFGGTWALAAAAGATGLGYAGLEAADLFDRNYSARFNIDGYADVNGAQKPTAGEWAWAIFNGVASAADLGAVARPFSAAVRGKLLAQVGLEAGDLARTAERLKYFDDLDTIAGVFRPLANYPAGLRSQISRGMSELTDPQILELSRILDDSRATDHLAAVFGGLDADTSNRLLRAMTGSFRTTDTQEQLALLARLKKNNPAAANALLASPEGYQNIAALRSIGSEKLVGAWSRHPDLQLTLDKILELRLDADLRGIDGNALLRGIGDHDADLVFGLAVHGGGQGALDAIAEGTRVAAARGLPVDFTPRLVASEGLTEMEVLSFGTATVQRTKYGVKLLASDSDEARSALRFVADRQNDPYDFSAAYPYMVPEDRLQVLAQGSSPAMGNYDLLYNQNRAVVESMNEWIKAPPAIFTLHDGRQIRILGPFDAEQSASMQEALRKAQATNPDLLDGVEEFHFMENIGRYEYANYPGQPGNYAAIYDGGAMGGRPRIVMDPAFARRPEILWHELGHRFWETQQLGGLKKVQNPFVYWDNVGRISWYGGTNAEENFCEAVSLVLRDQDLIRANPEKYIKDFIGYQNNTPAEIKAAQEKLAWTIANILGITIVLAPEVAPAPPDGRDTPTPY